MDFINPQGDILGKIKTFQMLLFWFACFLVQTIWFIKRTFVILVLITEHYDAPQGRTGKHLFLYFYQMVIMVSICSAASLCLGVMSFVIVRNVGLTCCQLLQEQSGFCIRFFCFLSHKTSVGLKFLLAISCLSSKHLSAGNLVHSNIKLGGKNAYCKKIK